MDMNEVPCREATSKLFLGPKYVEKMYNLIDVFRYYTCCSFAVIGFKADVSCIIYTKTLLLYIHLIVLWGCSITLT